ncbi:hypothetical protein [Nocardia sp. NPDC052316]|uniref:hypothetical protein n=1 Tax=Nocardia sp. NPDC052316 TaxID=3364329 RepID=UPI0037C668DB
MSARLSLIEAPATGFAEPGGSHNALVTQRLPSTGVAIGLYASIGNDHIGAAQPPTTAARAKYTGIDTSRSGHCLLTAQRPPTTERVTLAEPSDGLDALVAQPLPSMGASIGLYASNGNDRAGAAQPPTTAVRAMSTECVEPGDGQGALVTLRLPIADWATHTALDASSGNPRAGSAQRPPTIERATAPSFDVPIDGNRAIAAQHGSLTDRATSDGPRSSRLSGSRA